jgi:hypothetical protein
MVCALGCGRASRRPAPAATGGGGGAAPTAGSSQAAGGVRGGAGGRGGADGGSSAHDGGTSGTAGDGAGEAGDAGTAGMQSGAGTAGMQGTAGECSRTYSPCSFEPCGGDPTGNWVLESGCLGGDALGEACTGGSIEGTLNDPGLRLMFDEEGNLRASGRDAWDLTVRAPRACLGLDDGEPCSQGVLFTSALPFQASRSLIACQKEACGACECSGTIDSATSMGATWTIDGSQLRLDTPGLEPSSMPYCVRDDVLWLGGGERNGQTQAGYKLRKRSCTQTLPSCSARTTQEDCTVTQDCRWGACVGTPGSSAFCELWADFQCLEEPDCTWEADRCAPSGAPGCEFARCEDMPGCELGPPVAHCVGLAHCGGFEADDCEEPGCSLRTCHALDADVVSCANLTADVCTIAPGCATDGVSCEGTARCSDLVNDDVCQDIGCKPEPNCFGRPVRTCESLLAEECHTLPGCRIER